MQDRPEVVCRDGSSANDIRDEGGTIPDLCTNCAAATMGL